MILSVMVPPVNLLYYHSDYTCQSLFIDYLFFRTYTFLIRSLRRGTRKAGGSGWQHHSIGLFAVFYYLKWYKIKIG